MQFAAQNWLFFEDKEYTPQNYEGKYFGRVTLRKALAQGLVREGERGGFFVRALEQGVPGGSPSDRLPRGDDGNTGKDA